MTSAKPKFVLATTALRLPFRKVPLPLTLPAPAGDATSVILQVAAGPALTVSVTRPRVVSPPVSVTVQEKTSVPVNPPGGV